MDIFGYKALRQEIRNLRTEHSNLLYLVKVLAKQFHIVVEVHHPKDSNAIIAWVKEGDNTVNCHPIPDNTEQAQ